MEAPPSKFDLHMWNIEALVPSDDSRDPLREATVFRTSHDRFDAYRNGKSLATLAAAGLRTYGVHHFRSETGAGGLHFRGDDMFATVEVSCATHLMAADVAVVLHYEAATFEAWRRKYTALALQKIPAHLEQGRGFFSESVRAARRLVEASDNSTEHEDAEAAALQLWRKHKLAPPDAPRAKPGGAPVAYQQDGSFAVLSPWRHLRCHEVRRRPPPMARPGGEILASSADEEDLCSRPVT